MILHFSRFSTTFECRCIYRDKRNSKSERQALKENDKICHMTFFEFCNMKYSILQQKFRLFEINSIGFGFTEKISFCC